MTVMNPTDNTNNIFQCIVDCYRQCMFEAVLTAYSKCDAIVLDKDNDSFYLYDVPYKFEYTEKHVKDEKGLNALCCIFCLDNEKFYKLLPKYQEDSKIVLEHIVQQGKIISEKMIKALKDIANDRADQTNRNSKEA